MDSTGRTQATCVNMGDKDQDTGHLRRSPPGCDPDAWAPCMKPWIYVSPLYLESIPLCVFFARISSLNMLLPTQPQSAKKLEPGLLFFSQGPTHSKLSVFIFPLLHAPSQNILSKGKGPAWLLAGSFPNNLPMPWVLPILPRSKLSKLQS